MKEVPNPCSSRNKGNIKENHGSPRPRNVKSKFEEWGVSISLETVVNSERRAHWTQCWREGTKICLGILGWVSSWDWVNINKSEQVVLGKDYGCQGRVSNARESDLSWSFVLFAHNCLSYCWILWLHTNFRMFLLWKKSLE